MATTLLMDSLFWLAIALAGFACCVGALLVAAPMKLHAITRRLDRWYSLRAMLAPVDRPHYLERHYYRHHRLLGALLVAGAGYSLVRLTGFSAVAAAELLPTQWPTALQEAVVEGLVISLLLTNLFALVCGIVVYFRPSMLKSLEKRANHWLSTRQALRPLDLPHREIDVYLWHHERWVGALLLLAGFYILAMVLAYRGHLL